MFFSLALNFFNTFASFVPLRIISKSESIRAQSHFYCGVHSGFLGKERKVTGCVDIKRGKKDTEAKGWSER